jgi:signal transduction histidine kinase
MTDTTAKPWRYSLFLKFALTLGCVIAVYSALIWLQVYNTNYLFITQAEVSNADSFDFSSTEGEWRNIPLPRSWMRDELHSQENRYTWYRVTLPAQAHENRWNQLLILRHMMNLEIWLDDRFLGSAGPVRPASLQRNWNRPVMWTIPQSWITGDEQTLYMRLHSEKEFGVMSPLILGDNSAVLQRYRINKFLQIDLVKIGLMALLFIGALSLFAWMNTREQRWLLTLLMSASWAMPLLYIVMPTVSIAEFDFLRLSHWGTVTGAFCLLAFVYAYYLHTPLHSLRWLIALPLIHGILLAAIPDSQVVNIGSAGQLLAQILFVVLIVKLIRNRSLNDRQVFAVVGGLVIMLAAATHDISLVMSTSVERWRWDMPISYITQPVMLVIIAWLGLSSFLKGVKALDTLNRTLQLRLASAEQDIKRVYAEQESLEREIRMQAERETVYRDLHDDLGARLLSLVLKTDHGQARDLARSALQDLRDIVSRVLTEEQQLLAVLADSMAEHEGRAEMLQKSFHWEIDGKLEDRVLDSRNILNIRLLLRELIGSCLRLPDTHQLSFTASLDEPESLIITLCHDTQQSLTISPLLRKRLATLHADLQQRVEELQNRIQQSCIIVKLNICRDSVVVGV